jgi:hypothetical protein
MRKNSVFLRLLVSGMLLASFSASNAEAFSVAARYKYHYVELGVPEGYTEQSPLAISDEMNVVGAAINPDGMWRAMLWKYGNYQEATDISPANCYAAEASAINTNEVFISCGYTISGDMESYLYNFQAGTYRKLAAVPASVDRLTAPLVNGYTMNKNSTVVGTVDYQFTYWNDPYLPITLQAPDEGDYGQLVGINDNNDFIGCSMNSAVVSGFIAKSVANGYPAKVIDLGWLGKGYYTLPYAISKGQVVVGMASIDEPGTIYRAFVWKESTGIMELKSIGGTVNSARAINNRNEIVGMATKPSGEERAVYWTETEVTDLNGVTSKPLGITLSAANAINNSGVIAGYATKKGATVAYILVPISN